MLRSGNGEKKKPPPKGGKRNKGEVKKDPKNKREGNPFIKGRLPSTCTRCYQLRCPTTPGG